MSNQTIKKHPIYRGALKLVAKLRSIWLDALPGYVTASPDEITALGEVSGAYAMTFDEFQENIWFLTYDNESEPERSQLGKFNRTTKQVTMYPTYFNQYSYYGVTAHSIAFSSATGLWVLDSNYGGEPPALYNIDSSNGAIIQSIPIEQYNDGQLLSDLNGNVWVYFPTQDTMLKIDTGGIVSQIQAGDDASVLAATINRQGSFVALTSEYTNEYRQTRLVEFDDNNNQSVLHTFQDQSEHESLAHTGDNSYWLGSGNTEDILSRGLFRISETSQKELMFPGSAELHSFTSQYNGIDDSLWFISGDGAPARFDIASRSVKKFSTGIMEDEFYTLLIASNGDSYFSGQADPHIYMVKASQTSSPADTDHDGTPDVVENAAPNGGDANDDGTPDAQQANVTTTTSSVTGKPVTLVLDPACDIQSVAMKAESQLAATEASYEYANGLIDFTADCGAAGFTTSVTQFYHGVTPADASVRKFNTATKQYADLGDASISRQTVAGQTVTKATYHVTDNTDRDENNTPGIIKDPAGIATKAGFLAQTGQNALTATLVAVLLVSSGSALVVRSRRRTVAYKAAGK